MQIGLKQSRQKRMYDRHAHKLSELEQGKIVRMEPAHGQTWARGRVIAKVAPCSYDIQLESGVTVRRNRRQIRLSPGEYFHPEQCSYPSVEDDDGEEFEMASDENEDLHVEEEEEEVEDEDPPTENEDLPMEKEETRTRSGRMTRKPN